MTDDRAALDEIANMLYVAVVNPDLTWWDDLTPEMQEGWRRAARKARALPPDPERLERAIGDISEEWAEAAEWLAGHIRALWEAET